MCSLLDSAESVWLIESWGNGERSVVARYSIRHLTNSGWLIVRRRESCCGRSVSSVRGKGVVRIRVREETDENAG